MDKVTGRLVALKLLSTTSAHHIAHVRREVYALHRLQMEGVVRLLEVGTHAAEPFLVLELVDGTPFPGRHRSPTGQDLTHCTLALLAVLARVHAAGIVHGDIKPSNVLVSEDGRVTLLDFGLSRDATQDLAACEVGADLAGTPRYLSPEQVLGAPPDARADLYALGVMVFEAVSGRPPFPDDSFWPRVLERRTPPAPRLIEAAPHVNPALAAVVDHLLVIDPAARLQSAAAAMQALDHEPMWQSPGRPTTRAAAPLGDHA
ncbi:hypothetical protein LBMAG42_10890 [Deltaproteobacteria bacterium]|nr:hypothetical protein LBMAG42_10890 [Deltaproteobacteria bacterium]